MKPPASGLRSGTGGKVSDTQKAQASFTDFSASPQPFARLDELVHAQVRDLWWRLRRHHGVELPAEPDVILIDGGRR